MWDLRSLHRGVICFSKKRYKNKLRIFLSSYVTISVECTRWVYANNVSLYRDIDNKKVYRLLLPLRLPPLFHSVLCSWYPYIAICFFLLYDTECLQVMSDSCVLLNRIVFADFPYDITFSRYMPTKYSGKSERFAVDNKMCGIRLQNTMNKF